MSPLYRIAVFAGGAGCWAAIAAAWVFVSPAVAIGGAVGGIATALVATLELGPSADAEKPEEASPATGDEDFTIRRRDRRAIEIDAERSRDDVVS